MTTLAEGVSIAEREGKADAFKKAYGELSLWWRPSTRERALEYALATCDLILTERRESNSPYPDELCALYRAQYEYELGQRDSILGRLQVPLGVMVALGGGFAYLLQQLPMKPTNIYAYAYWAFVMISGLIMAVAVYLFARALSHPSYGLLHTPQQIEGHRYKLLESTAHSADSSQSALKEVLRWTNGRYAKFATLNGTINDHRIELIYLCNGALLRVIIPMILAFAVLKFGSINQQSVEMIRIIEPLPALKLTPADSATAVPNSMCLTCCSPRQIDQKSKVDRVIRKKRLRKGDCQ